MPALPRALERIAYLSLACAAACNVITGVNDLEVEGDAPSAGSGGSGTGGSSGSSSGRGGSGGTGNAGAGMGGGASGGTSSAGAAGTGGATVCVAGTSRDCLASGAPGYQVCSPDGQSYSTCAALAAQSFSIGIQCEETAECVPGLTCITSSDTDGGPQGGYCTKPCTGDATCKSADPESSCYTDVGYCLASCTTVGRPGAEEPLPLQLKCQGRQELACLAVSLMQSPDAQPGVCLPVCQSDADCSPRFCSLNTGLCEDTRPAGGGIGAPCTVATAATDCAGGLCQAFGASQFCSGACSVLTTGGCGFGVVTAQPREAACVDITATVGYGDLGICLELCDVAVDCQQAGWQCSNLAAFDAADWGRTGFCTPPGVLCSNRCVGELGSDSYNGDGECDDGGPGMATSLCQLGTDCADCGVR